MKSTHNFKKPDGTRMPDLIDGFDEGTFVYVPEEEERKLFLTYYDKRGIDPEDWRLIRKRGINDSRCWLMHKRTGVVAKRLKAIKEHELHILNVDPEETRRKLEGRAPCMEIACMSLNMSCVVSRNEDGMQFLKDIMGYQKQSIYSQCNDEASVDKDWRQVPKTADKQYLMRNVKAGDPLVAWNRNNNHKSPSLKPEVKRRLLLPHEGGCFQDYNEDELPAILTYAWAKLGIHDNMPDRVSGDQFKMAVSGISVENACKSSKSRIEDKENDEEEEHYDDKGNQKPPAKKKSKKQVRLMLEDGSS
jgi:hypothetical protein